VALHQLVMTQDSVFASPFVRVATLRTGIDQVGARRKVLEGHDVDPCGDQVSGGRTRN
jgi:hypothetical protein